MRFTTHQYVEAIKALQEGMQQLEPDGHCCSVCGDGGHQAFECGHNPLFAMATCQEMSVDARDLHDILHNGVIADPLDKLHNIVHYVAGFDTYMGERLGPARVVLPPENP